MYHINVIKTENIAVDGFGRIICSHPLARTYAYKYFISNYYAYMTQGRVTL